MSRTPWWLGPSAPVMPARSRANTTGTPCRPTSRLAWSKARLKNVEYIATTGRSPPMAMPAAEVTRLLGDPDVEEPVWPAGLEGQQAGGPGHGGGERDDPFIVVGRLEQRLGERIPVGGGAAR